MNILTSISITGLTSARAKNALDSVLGKFGFASSLTDTDTGFLLDWEIVSVMTDINVLEPIREQLLTVCENLQMELSVNTCKVYRTIQVPTVTVVVSAKAGGKYHYQVTKSSRPTFSVGSRENMRADLFDSLFFESASFMHNIEL